MTRSATLSLRIASVLAAAWLMASCGSSRSAVTARPSGKTPDRTEKPATKPREHIRLHDAAHMPDAAVKLLKEADRWIGVPYLYGGNGKDGVDCSGFVLQVYKSALGIGLPRNSAKQQEYATLTSLDNLREGDLVFFTVRGGKDVGHVGIYIGDGRMIHASSSKGVIISPLSQKYYVDNFHSCGRIEQYHAMLDRTVSKPAQPADRLQASAKPDIKPAQPARSAAETVTPKAPKAAKVKAEPAKKAPARTAASPVRTVTASKASAEKSDMNADRSKVLDSMIELKADSIFTSR